MATITTKQIESKLARKYACFKDSPEYLIGHFTSLLTGHNGEMLSTIPTCPIEYNWIERKLSKLQCKKDKSQKEYESQSDYINYYRTKIMQLSQLLTELGVDNKISYTSFGTSLYITENGVVTTRISDHQKSHDNSCKFDNYLDINQISDFNSFAKSFNN